MIRNFTPHDVVVPGHATFRSEGIARVTEEVFERNGKWERHGIASEIPVVRKIYNKEIENLPESKIGTIFIVSLLVLQVATDRNDLVCPDTGPDSVVRDEAGYIIGVRRFQC